MRKRRRIWAAARWGGLALSALLCAAWAGSYWAYFNISADRQGMAPTASSLAIGHGTLVIGLGSSSPRQWTGCHTRLTVIDPAQRTLGPSFRWPHITRSSLYLPIWVPLSLAVISVGVARKRERGGCGGCGYDLRGNTSGICPECGAAADVPHPVP